VYAVIRTGGKQYRVKVGDLIDVEKLGGDDGASLELEPLLVVDDDGNVTSAAADLAKAKVTASVVDQHRGRKIRVFTYKNKTRQRRTLGHRQSLTRLKVEAIDLGRKRATRSGGRAIHPGEGVGRGGDDTLFAKVDGTVVYHVVRGRKLASIDPGA
jgi:large subunit ribosomal protein L21